MLGYVRVNKPEMKVKEYETYRGIYCSLCKSLKKEYGVISTFILNYDITFLLLVLLSSEKCVPEFKKGRCMFNPNKRCYYCQNGGEHFSYAAAVTVIMFYFKVKDNIQDGSFFKRLPMYFVLPYASMLRKKAMKKYPHLYEIISVSMERHIEIEKSGTDSTDRAAHNSAEALGRIFDYNNSGLMSPLYRFGYFVGRWVYLVDAADDLEKDIRRKNFNVFVNRYELKDFSAIDDQIRSEIEGTLDFTHNLARDSYEKLDLEILKPIIDNIIYDSMNSTISKVMKGTKSQ
ncbi:MAG: hypothetical protein IJ262_07170 [Clostridia bacterium]|nr:hypothetical protein [Clostridia bacterium]